MRRRAGKVCGVAFLVLLCAAAVLHALRLHAAPDTLSPEGFRLVQWEHVAVWLTLLSAFALMLIVAVELSIVAWRLLHRRHPN